MKIESIQTFKNSKACLLIEITLFGIDLPPYVSNVSDAGKPGDSSVLDLQSFILMNSIFQQSRCFIQLNDKCTSVWHKFSFAFLNKTTLALNKKFKPLI